MQLFTSGLFLPIRRSMRGYVVPSVVLLLLGGGSIFITGCGGNGTGSSMSSSSTTLAASATSDTLGSSITFIATVAPAGSSGPVNFFDGTSSIGSGSLSAGKATFATSALAVGAHTITAVYGGNSSETTSASPALTVSVTLPAPTATSTALTASSATAAGGAPVTFTAAVSPSGATGIITFYDGSTSIGTGTLNAGIANVTTSSLAAGPHTITAGYGGNTSFSASSSPAAAIAIISATTTGLSESTAAVTTGAPVTLTASVSPAAATGTVTFYDGSQSIGTGTLNAGKASFTTSSLATGTRTITAAYGGSAFYAGSTASAATITVTGIATGTALSASAASAATGVSVVFTAKVSPAAATGTVTFYDGSTSIGTGTLNAGTATLASSSLAVGVHSITAAYGGDSTYGGGNAAAVAVAITALDEAEVAATGNPQVAAYTVTLPLPGTVTIDFGTSTGYGLMTSAQHFAAGTASTIYVAGMLASTTYHMRSTIVYDNGATQSDPDLTFTTGSSPTYVIPSFTVTPTAGLTPQPGVEFVDLLAESNVSIPFATDLNGNVIWTYLFPDRQPTSTIYPAKLLPNGHFMLLIAPPSQNVVSGPLPPTTLTVLREIDLAGNTVRQLAMADLNTSLAAAGYHLTLQVFHHDFVALPNGHILVIANTLKPVTLTGATTPTTVLGDVVLDLDQNFKPVWVWNEFDHLDVNRQPMGFPDWTHTNALAYSADDGNLLVSIRHQNWIIKVDYNNGAGSGDILWKLGYQGDFTLEGAVDPTDWFYAQHDVNFTSSNTTGIFSVAVMDNGDDRVFPAGVTCNTSGAPPCLYSSAQVMQVNENTKTASFVFHDTLPANLYNPFAGSVRVLPNGDVEYNLGSVGTDAYVFEVTPTATPQTIWQMHIKNYTYRSFRMPSLYPGVQW